MNESMESTFHGAAHGALFGLARLVISDQAAPQNKQLRLNC